MRYLKGLLWVFAVCSMTSVAAAAETYLNDCTSVAPEWGVRAPLVNLRVSPDGQGVLADFPAGTTGYQMMDLGLGALGDLGFVGAPIVVTDKTLTIRVRYDYTGTGPVPAEMMGCWVRIYSGTKKVDGTWTFGARQGFFLSIKPNAGWQTFTKSFADTPEDLYNGIPLDANNAYKARVDFVFWDTKFAPGTFGVEHFEISPAKAPEIPAFTPDPDQAYPGVEYVKELPLLQGAHQVTVTKLQGPASLVAGLAYPYSDPFVVNDTTRYQAIKLNGWTPTEAEVDQTYTVEVKAENGAGSDTVSWTVKVVQLPPIIAPVTPDPNPALAGSVYDKQLTLAQGTPPITWSVITGPTGLTISSTGKLGGWIPLSDETGQTFPITIRAANSLGSNDMSWTAVVQNVPPVIAAFGANPDSAYQGIEYVRKLSLSAGAPVVTWSIDQGQPGMEISQSGKLTGWTPTEPGTYTITVRAANNHGVDFDTETWQVNVVPAPTGADTAAPWGTIHANLSGTQSSNDPSIKFRQADWLNGAEIDWTLDVKVRGLDRPSDRGGISFDEMGNLYWKTNNSLLASVSPAGALRWTGTTGGGNVNLGTPDTTTPVVDNGGTEGKVYVLSDAGAAAFKKSDGTQVWATAVPGTNFSANGTRMTPVLYAGKLYVVGAGLGTKVVAQIDAATGTLDWSSSISGFDATAGGQMTLVPNALAPGVHGLYFNADGASAAGMYCVAVYPRFALLDWKDSGGKVARSHVIYVASAQRVCTHTWSDYGGTLYSWNLDGAGKSVSGNQANTAHGYYDQGCVDFNGTDIIAGGFSGQIVRYAGMTTFVPPCEPTTVIYDAGGFEAFTAGPLSGQNGWTATAEGSGMEPQIVTFDGTKCIKLEVPDVDASASKATYPHSDLIAANWKVIKVSFDMYRVGDAYPQNWWWYWIDPGTPTFGGQWDIALGRQADGIAGSAPFAWDSPPWVPAVTDAWTNWTLIWNLETRVAYGSYNGGPFATVGISADLTKLTDFIFELAHAEAGPTDGQVVYIDNFKMTGCTNGGVSGGPSSTGYYQLDPAYGEARSFGGLYQDTDGKSIFISGSNSKEGLTAKIYAFNVTDNTLYTETPATVPPPPDLQSPLFVHDTGVIRDHSFTVVGGPQLGPAVGTDTQHIYYFNGDASGTLVALKGKPRFMPDCDNDGKVNRYDLDDYFIPCYTGPMLGPPVPPEGKDCTCADLNKDGSVDQVDFGMFQRCFNGDQPLDPNCYP